MTQYHGFNRRIKGNNIKTRIRRKKKNSAAGAVLSMPSPLGLVRQSQNMAMRPGEIPSLAIIGVLVEASGTFSVNVPDTSLAVVPEKIERSHLHAAIEQIMIINNVAHNVVHVEEIMSGTKYLDYRVTYNCLA